MHIQANPSPQNSPHWPAHSSFTPLFMLYPWPRQRFQQLSLKSLPTLETHFLGYPNSVYLPCTLHTWALNETPGEAPESTLSLPSFHLPPPLPLSVPLKCSSRTWSAGRCSPWAHTGEGRATSPRPPHTKQRAGRPASDLRMWQGGGLPVCRGDHGTAPGGGDTSAKLRRSRGGKRVPGQRNSLCGAGYAVRTWRCLPASGPP